MILTIRSAGCWSCARKGRVAAVAQSIASRQCGRRPPDAREAEISRLGARAVERSAIPAAKFKEAGEIKVDGAVDAVLAGDLERMRELGGPLIVLALSSAARMAPPGQMLMGGDFYAIESRILAWLAARHGKSQNYRDFDRTGDPRREPYCAIASRMLEREVTPEDETGRKSAKSPTWLAALAVVLALGGGLTLRRP